MKTPIFYKPRPFPPRGLKRKKFEALLNKANHALEDYSAFLKDNPRCRSLILPLFKMEALASTQSLETITNCKDIFGSKRSLPIAKVNQYVQALKWGARNIVKNPLSVPFLCTAHKKIKQGHTPKIDLGVLRNRQNWIGPQGCSFEEAFFYPPPPKDVRPLTAKLCRFANRKQGDPLLTLAIFFSQFLLIHPFMDGNGRVVRLLIPLILYKKKDLPFPCVFLSPYFKRHRLQYILRLNEELENWIAFFLKAVLYAIRKEKAYLKEALSMRKISRQALLKLIKKYQK